MKQTVKAKVLTISTESACPLLVIAKLLFVGYDFRFSGWSAVSL